MCQFRVRIHSVVNSCQGSNVINYSDYQVKIDAFYAHVVVKKE